MATDLNRFAQIPDPEGERIAERARETRNAAPVVRYLRRAAARDDGARLGPHMLALLADALAGRVALKVRPEAHTRDFRELVQTAADLLATFVPDPDDVTKAARKLGYSDDQIADGRTRKRIAKHVIADAHGLTLRALDDRLNPRAGRLKRG
jgi:hypothetical protein